MPLTPIGQHFPMTKIAESSKISISKKLAEQRQTKAFQLYELRREVNALVYTLNTTIHSLTLSETEGLKPRATRLNPGSAPIIPYRWRDLPIETLLWYYAATIKELGNPILFTVHFTYETHKRMGDVLANQRDYIQQRIRRVFPGVDFYFVIERTSKTNILHIHGALSGNGMSIDFIKAKFQKISGDKRKITRADELFFANTKAVHIQSADWSKKFNGRYGDVGWAQYCSKDISKKGRHYNHTGTLIGKSASLTAKAKKYHEEIRSLQPNDQ